MYMYVYILFIIIGMFENCLICKQNHDTSKIRVDYKE